MMAMISRPTRATATTSVRRITGGNSLLLSGTGMPSCPLGSWRSPGKGFVGGELAAKGLAVEGLAVGLSVEGLSVEGLAVEGLAGTGLVGMTLTMVSPAEPAIIGRRDLAIRTGITTWRRDAGSNRGGEALSRKVARQRRPNGTADPRARLLVQSIQ